NASDGQLDVKALVNKAIQNEIDVLAITDHDTLAAYDSLRETKTVFVGSVPRLFSGVEISCLWSNMDIHVLGLDVDIDSHVLRSVLDSQKLRRQQRAECIARKL